MKFTKEVEAVIKNMTGKGIICIDKKDVQNILKRGKEITIIPKKNIKAKGALVYIEGTKNLSLNKINKIGDSALKGMRDDANIVWGAIIKKNLKRNKITVVYVY